MENEKAGLSGEQYEGIVSNSAEQSRTENTWSCYHSSSPPFPPSKPTIHNTQYTIQYTIQYNAIQYTIQYNTLTQSNQNIN